jgi:chromosome segregation ATPase
MTNPVSCSKCNIFLGNLYFLNSKINSTPNNIPFRKNKVFYIADDKTQYSYAYCQKCWPNNAINNSLIKQKTDPVIEANYALYLNEYADNIQNKKELKKNIEYNEMLSSEVTDLKNQLFDEINKHNITKAEYTNEIDNLQSNIISLKYKNTNVTNFLDNLNEKIIDLEKELLFKTEESECSLTCIEVLKDNVLEEQNTNNNLRLTIDDLKSKINDLNMVHFNYVNIIKNFDEKINEFKNIINQKDETINKLKNVNKINKKVMKNEYEHNKAKIFKLENYLNELNDFIDNNMTTNDRVQSLEHNLFIANDMRYNLLTNLEELRQKNITLEYTISDLCDIINKQENYGEYDCYYNYDELQNNDNNFVDETEEEYFIQNDMKMAEKLKMSHDDNYIENNNIDGCPCDEIIIDDVQYKNPNNSRCSDDESIDTNETSNNISIDSDFRDSYHIECDVPFDEKLSPNYIPTNSELPKLATFKREYIIIENYL